MAAHSVETMSTSPADSVSTPVDGVNVLGSLSPSRASDSDLEGGLGQHRSGVDTAAQPPLK